MYSFVNHEQWYRIYIPLGDKKDSNNAAIEYHFTWLFRQFWRGWKTFYFIIDFLEYSNKFLSIRLMIRVTGCNTEFTRSPAVSR